MYVHIFGYLVNKLEIWWVYLSPIDMINCTFHLTYSKISVKCFILHIIIFFTQFDIELLDAYNCEKYSANLTGATSMSTRT